MAQHLPSVKAPQQLPQTSAPHQPRPKVFSFWKPLLIFISLSMGVSIAASFLLPFEYRSEARMLVVPVQEKSFDAFAAAKAAERFGDTLAQVVYTASFQEDVFAGESVSFDRNRFSNEPHELRKVWKKKLKTRVARETGMLAIEVYDEDPVQAEGLLGAIMSLLATGSAKYHGAGDNIRVVVVDSPLTSQDPVRPNVFANIAIAFVVGVFAGVAYTLLRRTLASVSEWGIVGARSVPWYLPAQNNLALSAPYSGAQAPRSEFEEIADLELVPERASTSGSVPAASQGYGVPAPASFSMHSPQGLHSEMTNTGTVGAADFWPEAGKPKRRSDSHSRSGGTLRQEVKPYFTEYKVLTYRPSSGQDAVHSVPEPYAVVQQPDTDLTEGEIVSEGDAVTMYNHLGK